MTLRDLVEETGVTPRTVRYYIQAGLLPAPVGSGPASRYGEQHLPRLRRIRQLQRQHRRLSEIRSRLRARTDEEVAELTANPHRPSETSAVDYVRAVLAETDSSAFGRPIAPPPAPSVAPPASAPPQPSRSIGPTQPTGST